MLSGLPRQSLKGVGGRVPTWLMHSGLRLGELLMGRIYLFECSECGYRARVSGGADRGRHIAIQTILCANCRELYDVVVEFKASRQNESHPKVAPKFSELLNRLPPDGALKWIKFKLDCPVSLLHRARVWKQPDKCPKCGMHLELDGKPFRIWD
jgi:predicted nucleic acid-binding Zn ribbon protein